MIDDAHWQEYRTYCTYCCKWLRHIRHESCSTGQQGSLIMIDIAGMRKGCSKCHRTWPIANEVIHCGRGHTQPVEFVAQIPPLSKGDKVIKTDGQLSWVLKHGTHFVTIGKLEG